MSGSTPVPVARLLPGWYGKLPALGDFAVRRLPPAFVEPWDAWLCAVLAAGREGEMAFVDAALADRISLRFVLGAGVVTRDIWVGVIVPSADRVGRRFPLTVATTSDDQVDGDDSRTASIGTGPTVPRPIVRSSWRQARRAVRCIGAPGCDAATLDRALAESADASWAEHQPALPAPAGVSQWWPLDEADRDPVAHGRAAIDVSASPWCFDGLPDRDSLVAIARSLPLPD